MADRDRKNNPKNNESELFNKLTRLLSGPLVDFRKQSPRKLRRHQLNKEKFKSASGQSFKIEPIAILILTRWNTRQKLLRQ